MVPDEELPRERIRAIAAVYRARAIAFAEGHVEAERHALADTLLDADDKRVVAGSSYYVAASYFSLFDGATARQLFVPASFLLPRDNPASTVAAIIAGVEQAAPDENELPSPMTRVFETLSNDGAAALERAHDLDALPVGRLGIPGRYYLDLAREILALRGQRDPFERLPPSLEALLRRADEVVAVARRDHYHWSRLRSHILPAEPELITACLAFLRATPDAPIAQGAIEGNYATPMRAALRILEAG